MTSKEKTVWPSPVLLHFAEKQMVPVTALSDVQKHALKRLVSGPDQNLKLAYVTLAEKYGANQIDICFIESFEFYLDMEILHTCREQPYKDWLRKVSREAGHVIEAIDSPPSHDLVVSPELLNTEALILAGLQSYADDNATDRFAEIHSDLKRALQHIPVTMLLTEIVRAAENALEKSPEHYWENEYGIKAPRKHGQDSEIAREQVLLRGVLSITEKNIGRPEYELVTSLGNALLNTEKYTVEHIRKLPRSG